jgi:hypothetical protein
MFATTIGKFHNAKQKKEKKMGHYRRSTPPSTLNTSYKIVTQTADNKTFYCEI